MSPPRTASGAAAGAAVAILAACRAEVRQPVAYNHAIHVTKLELACDACHDGAAAGEVAGLPAIATCAACHQEANGKTAAEGEVVAAVKESREIAWARIFALERHVYFSHRRHVAVARIPCERCHGDMGAQARPPPAPLVALSMKACLDCHRQRGATRDCDGCHR